MELISEQEHKPPNIESSRGIAIRDLALQATASLLQIKLLLMRTDYSADSLLRSRLRQLRKVAESVAALSGAEELIGDVAKRELAVMAAKHGLPMPAMGDGL
ncbi:MAG: hypothetical protein WCC37_12745 [Candidatus Sulfotelmatobacter sp.]